MGINAHRALFSASEQNTYLGNLTVPDTERDELRDVRDTIRKALTAGFAEWSNFIEQERLYETAALQFADAAAPLRPKFRMQGSWSYHTLNQVTYDPPQEIDLDDGVFLPISFLTQHGQYHPAIVSSAYFSAVESILQPVCDANGWELDTEKQSCVRVGVRKGAHVDLALYAIPDDEFRTLVEKVEARALQKFTADTFDALQAFEDEVYPALPADHIMLAHRKEGWKPSDPRKLEKWFFDAVDRHTVQLRRVCRYLKGWRDHTWEGCRLSSIALMAAVVSAFDDAEKAPPENRDDLALDMVAAGLADRLLVAINNPVVPGQVLDEGWDADCRQDFVGKARELARELKVALAQDTRAAGLVGLRRALGTKVPDDISLLQLTVAAAPSVATQGLLGDIRPEEREPVKVGGEPRYG